MSSIVNGFPVTLVQDEEPVNCVPLTYIPEQLTFPFTSNLYRDDGFVFQIPILLEVSTHIAIGLEVAPDFIIILLLLDKTKSPTAAELL